MRSRMSCETFRQRLRINTTDQPVTQVSFSLKSELRGQLHVLPLLYQGDTLVHNKIKSKQQLQ